MGDLDQWEPRFEDFLATIETADSAHDPAHIRRVVATAKMLASEEGAQLEIVIPAAWLHDCVTIAKNDSRRSRASRLAAAAASDFLTHAGYDPTLIPAIRHAIEAHSFSGRIEPRTLEARLLRDADRLDALGAIGIARCLLTGGALGSHLYHPDEPLPNDRRPDDRRFVIDHFFTKLFELEKGMATASGRRLARQRTDFMWRFLDQLVSEVG